MKLEKRIMPGLMALIIAVALTFTPLTSNVYADYIKFVDYQKNITVSTVDDSFVLLMGKNIKNMKKVKVSSSNKSVAGITVDEDIYVTVKKPGKTTLTIQQKGSSEKYTCKLKVVKYTNAFKAFKLGDKNFVKKYNKGNFAGFTNKAKSPYEAKVNIMPKKGWKIKTITLSQYKYVDVLDDEGDVIDTDREGTESAIENKSMIQIQDKSWEQEIIVKMYNKKTKLTETYYLGF